MTGDGFLIGAAAGGALGAGRRDPRVLLLDQDFDPDTLPALRAALSAHALRAGLAEELAGDVVLAVHELAANAIAHGAGYGHLRLWRQPGTFSCEITDDGPPAQPGSAGTPADWPVAAGHGLWLARRLAARLDLWSDRRGSRAVITFLLPGDR